MPIHSGKPTGFGREIAGPTGDSTHPEEQIGRRRRNWNRVPQTETSACTDGTGFQLPCDLNVIRHAATRGLQARLAFGAPWASAIPTTADSRSPQDRHATDGPHAGKQSRSAADSRAAARNLAESLDQGRNSLNGKRDGHLAMRPIPGRRGCSFSGLPSPDHLTQRSRSIERRATDQKYDPERVGSRCFGKRQRVLEASLREPCGSGNRIQPAAFRATRKKVIADQLRFESYPYRNNCQSKTRREYRLDARFRQAPSSGKSRPRFRRRSEDRPPGRLADHRSDAELWRPDPAFPIRHRGSGGGRQLPRTARGLIFPASRRVQTASGRGLAAGVR